LVVAGDASLQVYGFKLLLLLLLLLLLYGGSVIGHFTIHLAH